jgi:hypothetical protein
MAVPNLAALAASASAAYSISAFIFAVGILVAGAPAHSSKRA